MSNVIFSDTFQPAESRILKSIFLVASETNQDLVSETFASYLAIAERTLHAAGFDYTNASFELLINNCNLRPEVYEAWKLMNLYDALQPYREEDDSFVGRFGLLQSKKESGGPVESVSDPAHLVRARDVRIAMQIGALGERIKARMSENFAGRGAQSLADLEMAHRARSEEAKLDSASWKEYLRGLMTKFRRYSNNAIAQEAMRSSPKHLPKRGLRTLQKYVKEVRAPSNGAPPKKIVCKPTRAANPACRTLWLLQPATRRK
jgi:hypothetical protein